MHLKHAFVVKRIQASREQRSIDFFHHCGGRTLWLVLLRFDRVAAGSAGHWLPQLAYRYHVVESEKETVARKMMMSVVTLWLYCGDKQWLYWV